MGKHRHERFRPGYAVVRLDDAPSQAADVESYIAVKEIWLSPDDAEAEAARLNALNADKNCRYFVQYTRVELKPDEH